MRDYEYRTVTIDYPKLRFGWLRRRLPDFDTVLNREARDGWRLHRVLEPADGFGATAAFVAIFERERR